MKISSVHVVGTTFKDRDVIQLAADLVEDSRDNDGYYNFNNNFSMEREPDNQYDGNAIKVMFDGEHMGYVNAVSAKSITDIMVRRNYSEISVDKVYVYKNDEANHNVGFWFDITLVK